MGKISGVEILMLLIVSGLIVVLSGCSFKVEFGYHGETGLDNRQQSALVKPAAVKRVVAYQD